MITNIEFHEILPIWQNYLWSNRVSQITPTSAMCFLGGFDLKNMSKKPIFLGYKLNDKVIGVNSLHPCLDGSYRSRGLYVFPEFRGKNIGYELLVTTINLARDYKSSYIWSYPKRSSWKTYEKAGFELASNWELSELDWNAYCIKRF